MCDITLGSICTCKHGAAPESGAAGCCPQLLRRNRQTEADPARPSGLHNPLVGLGQEPGRNRAGTGQEPGTVGTGQDAAPLGRNREGTGQEAASVAVGSGTGQEPGRSRSATEQPHGPRPHQPPLRHRIGKRPHLDLPPFQYNFARTFFAAALKSAPLTTRTPVRRTCRGRAPECRETSPDHRTPDKSHHFSLPGGGGAS
jgi:hypothetical protein